MIMVSNLYDLERDMPHLEWYFAWYLELCSSDLLDELKQKSVDSLLKGVALLHLSAAKWNISPKDIFSKLIAYIWGMDQFISLQKNLAQFDLYTNNATNLDTKRSLFLNYKNILKDIVDTQFVGQSIENNKAYAMFSDKVNHISHAVDAIDVLLKYKDRNNNLLVANRASLEKIISILQNLPEYPIDVWIDDSPHSFSTQITDFVKTVQKSYWEHITSIEDLLNVDHYIEGGLVPYITPPESMDTASRMLHETLWLNNPSTDVKRIAMLQEQLSKIENSDQKTKIFAELQKLYLEIYHKLYCVYSPNTNISLDTPHNVLSPENSAYQLIIAIENLLQKAYTDAQRIGGDLNISSSKFGQLLDSNKKLKQEILATIRNYYPQYIIFCDILESHNKWAQWDNLKTLEQLWWMDGSSYDQADKRYTVPSLDPAMISYFKKYVL